MRIGKPIENLKSFLMATKLPCFFYFNLVKNCQIYATITTTIKTTTTPTTTTTISSFMIGKLENSAVKNCQIYATITTTTTKTTTKTTTTTSRFGSKLLKLNF